MAALSAKGGGDFLWRMEGAMREGLVSDGVRRRIKQATRELIALSGGNGDAAALCGVREGTMSHYAGDGYPEVMPLDIAAALEMRLGRPVVSAVLADLSGFCVTPIGVGAAEPPALTTRLLGVVASGAAVTALTADALKDGEVTPREAREVCLAARVARGHIDDLERDFAARLTPRAV
jgi:hypothetical protein